MQTRYSDEEAQTYIDRFGGLPGSNADVALRVYTSRLIGRDPALVLHGGGNTSVKTTLEDDTGARVEVLCVKGSGWDLGDIEPAGLPAVRLDGLRALRSRVALDDEAMVNAQRTRFTPFLPLRVYRYEVGQSFGLHQDQSHSGERTAAVFSL